MQALSRIPVIIRTLFTISVLDKVLINVIQIWNFNHVSYARMKTTGRYFPFPTQRGSYQTPKHRPSHYAYLDLYLWGRGVIITCPLFSVAVIDIRNVVAWIAKNSNNINSAAEEIQQGHLSKDYNKLID